MISQGTGLLTNQIILVLILIVSRVSQPTGRQLVFIISQGLPPLAAGDRLKRRDRGSKWQPPVWALSCQSVRQHFWRRCRGYSFLSLGFHRHSSSHLLISYLSWQFQYFGIFSSHISSISSVLFLVWVATPFYYFSQTRSLPQSACWFLFGS